MADDNRLMTREEFNEKYRDYVEKGFEYGPLSFDIPEVTAALDKLFEEKLIHEPGFEVAQIKLKFNKSRFYSSLDYEYNSMVETMIDEIIEAMES